jgi:hypothetical protein
MSSEGRLYWHFGNTRQLKKQDRIKGVLIVRNWGFERGRPGVQMTDMGGLSKTR